MRAGPDEVGLASMSKLDGARCLLGVAGAAEAAAAELSAREEEAAAGLALAAGGAFAPDACTGRVGEAAAAVEGC